MRARFGDCVFDSEARELRRAGRVVRISPKGLSLLELLLENRPRALSKSEIHDRLWPETFVAESSLARLVCEVRKAIGDGARDPKLLRTVYGFGYALSEGAPSAPEIGSAPGAVTTCRLSWGEREIPLFEGENVLGRMEDAIVRIDSPRVSRRHARIVVSSGRAVLEDLGSKNGTYLRGQRIEAPSDLVDGDEICVGPVVLVYHALRGSGSTETDDLR